MARPSDLDSVGVSSAADDLESVLADLGNMAGVLSPGQRDTLVRAIDTLREISDDLERAENADDEDEEEEEGEGE
jgi:hypothetical protein